MTYYGQLEIKLGKLTGAFNETGALVGLWFENQKYYPQLSGNEQWIGSVDIPEIVDKHFQELENQLKAYEDNKISEFNLPLAPTGTQFRQIVWGLLQEIPYGQTTTYGEIGQKAASLMGKKTMSAQAVGGAVGHNPISIIIPCHRVLGSDGSMTGYAGGIEKKVGLLVLEGAISSIDK